MSLLNPPRPRSSYAATQGRSGHGRSVQAGLARVPRLDWVLLLASAALLVIGTVLVWSATTERGMCGAESVVLIASGSLNVWPNTASSQSISPKS